MNNIALRIFSVLIAVLLAYFVNSDSNTSVISLTTPVEIKNVPTNKIITGPVSRQAQITIRGPSFDVSRIAAQPPVFKIKLPDDVENRFVVTLKNMDLALPPYVRVMQVDPAEMEITLDSLSTKQVPVVAPRVGLLPDHLKFDGLVLSPDHVTVSGPEMELEKIKEVETYPLSLSELRTSHAEELNLRPPGVLTSLSVSKVNASIRLSDVVGSRRFEGLPIELRSLSGEKYTLRPGLADVEISGPKLEILNVRREEVIPFVRLKPESGDSSRSEVLVDVPSRFTVARISPNQIELIKVTTPAVVKVPEKIVGKLVKKKK